MRFLGRVLWVATLTFVSMCVLGGATLFGLMVFVWYVSR